MCYNFEFYRQPKIKKQLGSNSRKKETEASADDSWKGLEARVAKDLSKIPEFYNSRRQLMSGALWFAPGDVDDNTVLIECKERMGNIQEAKGTKSFTIDKGWLDKAQEESKRVGRPLFLPFRFKEDDQIHVVTQWHCMVELITATKTAHMEVEKKDAIIKQLMYELNMKKKDVI